MEPGRIKLLTEWPSPKGWKGDLETFPNIANYYSPFIRNFTIEAAPLRGLGVRGAMWQWDAQKESAFRRRKELIAGKLLLEYPDYKSEFRLEIHTDACQMGMGAALVQQDNEGVEHIIELASRVTDPREKNYPIWELEAAAVVWALKKFKSYIHGIGPGATHRKVARWQMLLDDYGAIVEFRPGKKSGNVDALSRIPERAHDSGLGG
ncbi:retrotransposable element [Pelomyxa schiedti]|nr:retrotransposable element [Pelomyxa schiedti]